MESAMCGSRSRFRYFWRVLIWLKRMWEPSQSNQTGVLWGSPLGPMVAICASAVVCSKLVYSCGITAIVCFLSLLDVFTWNYWEQYDAHRYFSIPKVGWNSEIL